jgi:hypothetical protein
MGSLKISRFQFFVLTALTVCAVAWLLVLTGFKEYWGFWQSPEEYSYLQKEYPQWIRDYVLDYYYPTLYFVLVEFFGWLILAVKDLRAFKSAHGFYRRLILVLLMILFLGATMGVRYANNFIGWLDNGKIHGTTSLRVRP